MSNRENLDLSEDREIKTYAEMSDMEKAEFKEKKEQELEDLKKSLVEYGIPVKDMEIEGSEGVEIKIEEKEGKEGKELRLIIDQVCGKGITGLGFYRKLWVCLNQERVTDENGSSIVKDTVKEYDSDANTKVSSDSDFKGVKFEKVGEKQIKVQIDSDHPAIAMAEFLGDKEIQLQGGYNNWGDSKPFKFNKEGKWEVILDWNGTEEECKIMIRDIEYREGKKVTKPMEVEWNGKFGKGARQIMEIVLEPEQGLDE